MTRIILLLIILAFAYAVPDPNAVQKSKAAWDTLIQHWLEVKSVESKVFDPNVPVKHVFYVWPCDGNQDNYLLIRARDPNSTLDVTRFHKNRFNMEDFAIFARQYPGDPNFVPPPEPNEPNILDGITDSNLLKALKELLK